MALRKIRRIRGWFHMASGECRRIPSLYVLWLDLSGSRAINSTPKYMCASAEQSWTITNVALFRIFDRLNPPDLTCVSAHQPGCQVVHMHVS